MKKFKLMWLIACINSSWATCVANSSADLSNKIIDDYLAKSNNPHSNKSHKLKVKTTNIAKEHQSYYQHLVNKCNAKVDKNCLKAPIIAQSKNSDTSQPLVVNHGTEATLLSAKQTNTNQETSYQLKQSADMYKVFEQQQQQADYLLRRAQQIKEVANQLANNAQASAQKMQEVLQAQQQALEALNKTVDSANVLNSLSNSLTSESSTATH
jgi:lysyl-tRNA synthetase class I